MKDGLTQIAVVLDRSGSMGGIQKATIESFNGYIDTQKASGDDVDVLFVQFDTENSYEVMHDGKISDCPVLTDDNYQPRGGTPLHDAIGQTITSLGERLAAKPESERPSKVVVLILTDGYENASHIYDTERVAALVKQQTEIYKWLFVFLGANQDAILTAKSYAIHAGSSMTYNATSGGIRSAIGAASSITDLWKFSSSSLDPCAVNFTVTQRLAAEEKVDPNATQPGNVSVNPNQDQQNSGQ